MERLNKEGLRYYTSLIQGLIHQGSGNVARITEQQIQDLFGAAKVYEIRYWTANNQQLNLEENMELPDGWVHHGYSEGYGLVTSTVPIETFPSVFIQQPALTQISLPEGVTSIGARAFRGCSGLISVYIPEGVTHIETEAFKDCSSLPAVTIPNSVTSIGSGVFNDCSSLQYIITSTGTYYSNENGDLMIIYNNNSSITFSGCLPRAECVLPGTQILTSLNGNTRCVEDLQEGDSIITHDGNSLIEGVVSKTVTISHNEYIKLTLDNGVELGISYDHAIDTPSGWKAYKPQWSEVPHEVTQLVVGDVVNTVTGSTTIINIEEIHETRTMYNLGVKGYHNYFANGVLVHECSNDE